MAEVRRQKAEGRRQNGGVNGLGIRSNVESGAGVR
jgi:hypothetical protein